MAKRKSKKEYKDGRIKSLWPFLSELHKSNPKAFDDPAYLKAVVSQTWTHLKNGHECPNCGASMAVYAFSFDYHDAKLLLAVADEVIKNTKKGLVFTEANKVHVQKLSVNNYTIKSRTTQCAKLGLLAKVMKNGKQVPGMWLITRRGWEALGGKKIPKTVEVFRNSIQERGDEEITLQEVLNGRKESYDSTPYVRVMDYQIKLPLS
jgi:hypothetical protein